MLKRTRILIQNTKRFQHYIPPSERVIKEHDQYMKKKQRNERIGKIIHYTFFSIVGGSLLMYLWQPWNPYSKDVSKELRKGLWEERDGKDDYLIALKHYQNALKTSKDEHMDQLSLKYTGIVLKIAEMYEKLNMNEQLLLTYYNLSTFIFENLIHDNIKKDNLERDLLIDRDLITITRWAMLKNQMKSKNWAMEIEDELKDRIGFIENHEIKEKFPWMIEKNTEPINEIELIEIWAKSNGSNKKFKSSQSKWIEDHIDSEEGKQFLECWDIVRSFQNKEWPSWMTSYLRLRDYYAMFQMSRGDLLSTIKILQSNLLWLTIAGFSDAVGGPTQIMNLASAWFKLGQLNNDPHAFKKAKNIYEKLLSVVNEKDPILPITYYSLGVLDLQQKETESAKKNFDIARELAIQLDQLQIIDKIDDELLQDLKQT
jgi:tetratricopeptide (TPR) repeat protein